MCDNYVTAESGTGIVHQAPYFGEVSLLFQAKFWLLNFLNITFFEIHFPFIG